MYGYCLQDIGAAAEGKACQLPAIKLGPPAAAGVAFLWGSLAFCPGVAVLGQAAWLAALAVRHLLFAVSIWALQNSPTNTAKESCLTARSAPMAASQRQATPAAALAAFLP